MDLYDQRLLLVLQVLFHLEVLGYPLFLEDQLDQHLRPTLVYLVHLVYLDVP